MADSLIASIQGRIADIQTDGRIIARIDVLSGFATQAANGATAGRK